MEGNTLIVGSGPMAERLSREIQAGGGQVIIAVRDSETSRGLFGPDAAADRCEFLAGVKPIICRGSSGQYEVIMDQEGTALRRERTAEMILLEKDLHHT